MRKLWLFLLSFLPVLIFLAVPAMVLAQEAPAESFDLTPFFPALIGAFLPIAAYVALYFVKAWKAKIPNAIRPILPMGLAILSSYLGGLATSTENVVIAAAIGLGVAVLAKVIKELSDVGLTGATVPGTDTPGQRVR